MVLREWRGRADQANADAYPTHFRRAVLPELRTIPGFLGASLSQRPLNGQIEFLVLTRWRSIDAIEAFAGGDIGRAVVEPGGVAALVEFDATARHYEIIEEAAGPGT
jgi:heme-degrading monooxygenase HmoA